MTNTKFFNIILAIIIVTFFSLGYVSQEVAIVRTSVLIDKHRREVSFLLDHYRSLVYNLSRLESPKRIEETLSLNEIELCMPRTENIRHMERVNRRELDSVRKPKKTGSFLARIFDRFSVKAEAKVVD